MPTKRKIAQCTAICLLTRSTDKETMKNLKANNTPSIFFFVDLKGEKIAKQKARNFAKL